MKGGEDEGKGKRIDRERKGGRRKGGEKGGGKTRDKDPSMHACICTRKSTHTSPDGDDEKTGEKTLARMKSGSTQVYNVHPGG